MGLVPIPFYISSWLKSLMRATVNVRWFQYRRIHLIEMGQPSHLHSSHPGSVWADDWVHSISSPACLVGIQSWWRMNDKEMLFSQIRTKIFKQKLRKIFPSCPHLSSVWGGSSCDMKWGRLFQVWPCQMLSPDTPKSSVRGGGEPSSVMDDKAQLSILLP